FRHRSRAGLATAQTFGRLSPEAIDGPQPRSGTRLDEDDQSKTPCRKRSDFGGLRGAAHDACTLMRHREAFPADPAYAVVAVPEPLAQRILIVIAVIDVPLALGVTPVISRRAVVADELDDLAA